MQFTNIPINCSLFKEKSDTGLNFIIPVFLQYVIFSVMHQKVWFSQIILSKIDRILTWRKIYKSESCLSFSFSPTGGVTCQLYYLPQDTHWHPGRSLTPQDAQYMARKSFILFYMINYHEVIPFLVYLTVSHSKRCKFYSSYWTCIVNSMSLCHLNYG